VDCSDPWLRAYTQHDRGSRIIESFGDMPEYLGHRGEASIEKIQPHRAASVPAASAVRASRESI
jgi:uncharacterized SAM-dependent methyltransferase